MASMMMSQSLRSSSAVVPLMRPRISDCCTAVMLPFSANFARDFSIPAKPRSHSSSVTSRTTTSQPAAAAVCAMPEPISPQPSTPTFFISISSVSPVRFLFEEKLLRAGGARGSLLAVTLSLRVRGRLGLLDVDAEVVALALDPVREALLPAAEVVAEPLEEPEAVGLHERLVGPYLTRARDERP